ncbi:class II glutamine amidotransferase [Lichenihabitans sp. Uapishka_5]|uniref:class II glutamine amidotransferase n=1 Tax=Lichenihabitans sp. Uapishka_5 TaxID=3037302 RepID=UPI0029E7EC26|nr:class II glutamine amidotransferase [Lichenihabitans sp. Uapishka_5]MDX7950675.1 class II glutamine amidotransferase [Lichenihabitans sp. Uapishka_5]
MCRWIAYQGEPIFLDTLVAEPAHSLIAQSLHAAECKAATNGDGFGVGWYGERDVPGLYRETRPAWSDENLRNLCAQVKSRLFFAHVRSSTGPATARANCHPFAVGNTMFMHNGQIGGYPAVKRRLEALIADDLYAHRAGSTDSEALFLTALTNGLTDDPIGAVARTLLDVQTLMRAASVSEPLRFAAATTDGTCIHAFRWASDGRAPSLYWRQTPRNLLIVSEPLDGERARWREVPQGCALIAMPGEPVRLAPIEMQQRRAA